MRHLFHVSLIIGAIATVSGCAQPVWVLNDAFNSKYVSRYTLHGGQSGPYRILYSTNYISDPYKIPPGKDVSIQKYSAMRVDMVIDGISCQMLALDQPFPVDDTGIRDFITKHFAQSKEELGMDEFDRSHANMINQGEAAISMTKEQILLALGYPGMIDGEVPTMGMSRDRIMQSNTWLYRSGRIMWAHFWPSWAVCRFDPSTGQLIGLDC